MSRLPFLRRRPSYTRDDLTKVPDDLPPTSLTAPLVVNRIDAGWDAEHGRAEFRVIVRDAKGQRCPDLAVEARIDGPERSASAEITTSLMGAALFRMAGPPGTYTCTVVDVGARGIAWDPEASTTQAEVHTAG